MTKAPAHDGRLRAVAVVPARIASTRLPRKVLLAETGTPLFVHTARNVARCPEIQRVVVATDGEEVCAAGAEAEIEVVLTSPDHPSGTDRVNEAIHRLEETYDVVLNVQADEPDVEPEDLARLVSAFKDPGVQVATLAVVIQDPDELRQPSVVKVVRDRHGRALYFSRAEIPDTSHTRPGGDAPPGLRHVGVYAFRPTALDRFCSLPQGELETTENLEQLRWLEAGGQIQVLTAHRATRGIDTAEDYRSFVTRQQAD